MTLRPSPQIEAELLSKGPGDFYTLASMKHQTAIVHGKDETVVGIGTAKLIMVPNGLRSLDRYDKTYYDPSLAATIANQHLVLATVPFDPHAPFAVVVPEIAVQFTSEQEIIISSHSSNNDKTQALLWEILEQSYADSGLLHLSRLQYLQTDQDFERRVAEAVRTISTSEITKIVLCRRAQLRSAMFRNSGLGRWLHSWIQLPRVRLIFCVLRALSMWHILQSAPMLAVQFNTIQTGPLSVPVMAPPSMP